MSGESFGVDFVAGEQEQERHAELVQEFHGVVYFDYAQSVRAECGSGGEQQYGLWNEPSRNQLRHNRADGRHRHDDGQGNKLLRHTVEPSEPL